MTLRTIALLTGAVLGVSFSATAAENGQTRAEACKGQMEIVRVSKVKPAGSMAGLLKAAADHEAWFKSHGYASDVFVVASVMQPDPVTKTYAISDGEVLTMHLNPTYVPPEKQDAAYQAFVKAYRDNSDITTEKWICLPSK